MNISLTKIYLFFIFLIVVVSLSPACNLNQTHLNQTPPTLDVVNPVPVEKTTFHIQTVAQTTVSPKRPLMLASESESTQPLQQKEVSLEVKIGQMLMVGFRGSLISDPGVLNIVRDIKKYHLGGVILFDYDMVLKSPRRNIRSPKQVQSLIQWLQVASPNIPLFVAIDEEGGKIHRLKKRFGFQLFTQSAHYLGQKGPTLTYEHAFLIAETLSELGINFNFAPVVDLNLNPNNPVIGKLGRSFSAKPDIVTQHALRFIEAHHENDILCAIKHFPGHGSSTDDSHLGFVDVTRTWNADELVPYQNIINAGMADAIMMAHVFNGELDKKYPATLSQKIITNILRSKLNYKGVIISDDMQMKAISKRYHFKKAIQTALQAGVDIIVIGNNLEYDRHIVRKTITFIKGLIKKGKLEEARINASFMKIQALKKRLVPVDHYQAVVVEDKIGSSSCRRDQNHRLIIKTLPSGSQIKLANIKPYYKKDGICLKSGWYAIYVTHQDYLPNQYWVEISDSDVSVEITLKAK
ncbi:MAG: glycoside hydrolase family 3 [Candidatus Parabeggiatoa sp. nov. 3]|nr:MAG: glycoside hydrolase family 3 [Gammaproteobacteria bacterium]RKZ68877.1 MAG: glycoside hydrolase family 3 [Gammaproteobacteria bacterium]RKZ79616.1 MAG: glycoside hydrolase family 3 [Gammaproteobacteria bacterium]HEW97714.1 glycoside hydrolase family 3 [Beggiatoa sp.]